MVMASLPHSTVKVAMMVGGTIIKYPVVEAIPGPTVKVTMDPGSTTKCMEPVPTSGAMVGSTLAHTIWTKRKVLEHTHIQMAGYIREIGKEESKMVKANL
jgi:hypothetical protein